jgi:hypothetical protein
MKIEVSNGEIVDKFTILEIKLKNSNDPIKTVNIEKEYNYLKNIVDKINAPAELLVKLKEINQELWYIEDQLRVLESKKIFIESFVNLARKVYITNDLRASVKHKINIATNSNFIEEKILPEYKGLA